LYAPKTTKMQVICKSRKNNRRDGNGASQEIISGNYQEHNIHALALHRIPLKQNSPPRTINRANTAFDTSNVLPIEGHTLNLNTMQCPEPLVDDGGTIEARDTQEDEWGAPRRLLVSFFFGTQGIWGFYFLREKTRGGKIQIQA